MNKPKLNQPDVEQTTTVPNITIENPNITIEKATPEQFISGVKVYLEKLESVNEELKTRLKENEYTIKQLNLILNSSVLKGDKQ